MCLLDGLITLCMSPAHRRKNTALLTGITLSRKLPRSERQCLKQMPKEYNEDIAAEEKMGPREE